MKITEKGVALTVITNLFEVLKFTRVNSPSKFTAGERTCIHQHIAALFQAADELIAGADDASVKCPLPEGIEKKVNEVLLWINR